MAFNPLRHHFTCLIAFCFITFLIVSLYISTERHLNVPYKSRAREYNTFIINQGEEVQYKEIPNKDLLPVENSKKYLNNYDFGHLDSNPHSSLQNQKETQIEPDIYSWNKEVTRELSNNQIKPVIWKNTKLIKTDEARSSKNPAFIIDTSTCKIPKFDPWDSSVRNLIHLYDPYVCPGLPVLMSAQPHGSIYMDINVLQKYYNYTFLDEDCWYWKIVLKYEPDQIREDNIILDDLKKLYFYMPLDGDNVAVKCYFKNNFTVEQYFPLVRLKDEIETKKSGIKPTSPLNIILLGIDSVSKLQFMRHFRQTKSFLQDKMKPFDMKGYIKVADNTILNLVPMLTGYFVDYYWNETVRDTFFFDNLDLIWKDYANQGYRTFFAEDAPFNGMFNYFKRGFSKQPTDYYYRPTALMMEHSELRLEAKKYNSTCINSQLETDIMYDHLINFVKTMNDRPYFAFSMVSILTHDVANHASFADAPAARLLKELDAIGALNNSALVIFSDHGIRYGEIRGTYIGKIEERMPFMYVHFPKWFLDQHPHMHKNLVTNQDRLMTLFDIHATLKHLLDPTKDFIPGFEERGLSLLNEIPEDRTCEEANIEQHWCPCNNFEKLEVSNPAVVNASHAIVNHINMLLQRHADVCETLELNSITDARLGMPNEKVVKYQGHVNEVIGRYIVLGNAPPTLGDYLITLTVKPGGAIFEGTVRYNAEKAISNVMDISRINMYGTQSWCIDSARLKLYCFCKVQIT